MGLAEVRMLEGDFLGTPPCPRAPLWCYMQLMQGMWSLLDSAVSPCGGVGEVYASNVKVTYVGLGESWHRETVVRSHGGSGTADGGVWCFLIT